MSRHVLAVRACVLVVVGLVAGALAGCSKQVPVEGTVKYKGQPVEGALVSFCNDQGVIIASGQTDGSGKYKLMTPQAKQEVPSGTYKVTVTKVAGVTVEAEKHTDPEGRADPTAAMK